MEEKKVINNSSFKKFNKNIYKESKILNNKFKSLKKLNKNIIGYGAPARVSAITNIANIDSSLLNYIIDDSPLKQNKFSPGKHIRILSAKNNISDKIDIVIVFAYEYFRDIRKKFKNYKPLFYKPIPFKKLI